jgi:gliding motility-associated-like protein
MNLFARYSSLLLLLLFCFVSSQGQVAGFTSDVTSGCAPLVVHFTNTSTGATLYKWVFGNGSISYLTNSSTSYITSGTFTCTLIAYNGSDSTTHTETITVFPAPTVTFVASDTAVCPGAPVTFSSTGSAGVSGAVTYSWNFGDGSSSTLASPSHGYATSGYKNVILSVTNSEGCVASLTKGSYIDVFTPAAVNFTAAPNYVCDPPANVTFNNTTTGASPLSYEWYFGDGTSPSSATDPTHTYASTGDYSVKLVVTDGNGCIDSLTKPAYIIVGGITGSFTAPSTACLYTPVLFDNTTPGSGITSSWSFGTGATSGATSPAYTYNTAGTYTVTLVVYNGHCYDTITHTITILPEPVSSFTWTPTNPCPAPASILFTGTVPSGSSVAWTFGDGGTGTGTGPTHTYGANGTDTIKMVVTNGSGCKDTVTHVNHIYNLSTGIGTLDDSTGCAPLTVHFVSYAITTVPGPSATAYPFPVTSYSWYFGDGSAGSTAATPAHTFTAAGVYTVTLTQITSNGCSQTSTKVIRVGTPPVASFTAAPFTICADSSVSFTNTSTGADSYYWNFGDGTGSTLTDPVHVYSMPDTFYSVTLIAYYNGCPDSIVMHHYITVDSPKALILATRYCSPAGFVGFTDSSFGANTHEWFFGDGTTSTAVDPTHTYSAISTYTVTLTTYNILSGCRDTATDIITLVAPAPHIHADDTAICKFGIVHLHPSVTGGTAAAYAWSVNGAYRSDDSLFIDTFNVTGHYTISLEIMDQNGCYDTVTNTNYIIVAKPVDSFTVAPPSGCWPLNAIFTDHSTDVTGTTFTNFSWTFGDGGTASVGTPSTAHSYTNGGTYSVREIVTDNIGCKDTITYPALVTVYKPAASFYASNLHPCIGAPVTFTNLSVGIISSFWMFGDGGTSSSTSATHTYLATGLYTVKLVVTDAHGCTDTASYPAYITVSRPAASFYMTDSFSLCPPLSVNFINTSAGAVSYKWYLGDGSTSLLIAPSDIYTTIQYDTVLLIAKDSYGCPDTAVGHINIFGSSGGFSYTPLSGCSPLTVHFSATISNVPNIVWDFSDGTTTAASFSDSTVHTYTIPGAYVPKLILSDNTGCEKSSQGLDTIKVDAVIPGFTAAAVCINQPFTLEDTSGSYFSTITAAHWTFSSGDTSDAAAPTYVYTTTGSFPVSLVVTDGWGCKDSVTRDIGVYPPPVIGVSKDTTVCVGDPALLTGSGGVSYTWAPASSVSCTLCNTTDATPSVVTHYTVTGTDAHGCQGTDTVTVFLRKYTYSAGWGDTAICQGIQVPLFDTGGTKYTWIPAAGLSDASVGDPVANPGSTTIYTVIAQFAGCIPDTNYVTVTVYPLPTVNAGNDQSVVAGTQVQLNATGTYIATYTWSPDESLNCSTCSNPLGTPLATTTYTVDVSSSYGCRSSDTVTIHLFCDKSQVFIPNSFTPNGDGQNDLFYPRGSGISLVKSFRIYNRWGELLFEKSNISINDASNAWDGSYNGTTPRPDVYVYIIDAVCDTGEPINLKGDVTIIR